MIFTPDEQAELITWWDTNLSPSLSPKAVNQFVSATKNPKNWFVEEVLKPHVFMPNKDMYHCVDTTHKSEGRNHELAEAITMDSRLIARCGGRQWLGLTYFTNAMRFEREAAPEEKGDPLFVALRQRPMDRVVLGEHQIFTYEFDVPDISFLEQQLAWLRSSGNSLERPVGRLYKLCSGFADFAGITVNYSGNKSLHIHVVFKTALARARLCLDDFGTSELRTGIAAHWDWLHSHVVKCLDVEGRSADASLRLPEAFRRIPNGTRVLEKDNILGIIAGTRVQQLTLWEKRRRRASRDDLPLFFSPELFRPAVSQPVWRGRSLAVPAVKVDPNVSDEVRTFWKTQLDEIYCDWPRFDHLTFESDQWVAKFRNHEEDKNPSSVMREAYRTVLLMGSGSNGLRPKKLPFALGIMLTLWRAQFECANEMSYRRYDLDDFIVTSDYGDTVVDEEFRRTVVDLDSAKVQMRQLFRDHVSEHSFLIIKGPEGVGKTTVLMEQHHKLLNDLAQHGADGVSMYVFDDYADATKKCATFNSMQRSNGYVGVVLPSFSRAYNQECEALRIKPISLVDAIRNGYQNVWEAAAKLQPPVIAALRKQHEAIWTEIGSKRPVFFSVHQVAQQWHKSGITRMMWAKQFWMDDTSSDDHRDMCRRETSLALLVHDEIKAESFVEMYPSAVKSWVDELLDDGSAVWRRDAPVLSACLNHFEDYAARFPPPQGEAADMKITFDMVHRISQVPVLSWDAVTTSDTNEYGKPIEAGGEKDVEARAHHDIYAERHGQVWDIIRRNWWQGAAAHVVVLTTECAPVAVAQAADTNWKVIELETPRIPVDDVEVRTSRSVRSAKLATLCTDFRADHPDEEFFIVSNKVSMLPDAMTHMAARGSNDLIGKNVVQTMTFMSPGEYEGLQALNAWTGRRDLVGLRHIDEFNQTAGRNLGFRKRGAPKHVLLVHRRLFELLIESGAVSLARYGLRLCMDADARYEVARLAA